MIHDYQGTTLQKTSRFFPYWVIYKKISGYISNEDIEYGDYSYKYTSKFLFIW